MKNIEPTFKTWECPYLFFCFMLFGWGENNFFLDYIYKSQEVLITHEILWDTWDFFQSVSRKLLFSLWNTNLQYSLQFYSMLYTFFMHTHSATHSFSTKSEARLFPVIWTLAQYLWGYNEMHFMRCSWGYFQKSGKHPQHKWE